MNCTRWTARRAAGRRALKFFIRSLPLFLCSVISLGWAGQSTAATMTYDIVGQFSQGQLGTVNYDFTLTHDFSLSAADETSGVIINSLTSTVATGNPFLAGIGFDYDPGTDSLVLGSGDVNEVNPDATDFRVFISSFTSATPILDFGGQRDSLAGEEGSILTGLVSIAVTDVAAVPLPAGWILLLSGLAAAAGFGHRKRTVS